MMKQRFVVLPGTNIFNRGMDVQSIAFLARTAESVGGMAAASAGGSRATRVPVEVVETMSDGAGVDAMLIQCTERERLALRAAHPDLRVIPEGLARMALSVPELQPIPSGTMTGAKSTSRSISVRVEDVDGKVISGADVIGITNSHTKPLTGVSLKTNKKGVATFVLPTSVKLEYLRAEPIHSYWPIKVDRPSVDRSGQITVQCPAIVDGFDDALVRFTGPAKKADGRGVVVAVVDGGAGPHAALKISGGANLVEGESDTDWADNGIGHGTHVAGIIASQSGAGAISGIASAVTLRSYRVFGKNSMATGSFAVAAAIRRALDEGADIINLSLTFPDDQPDVFRQIARARALGAVIVAAAGNDAGKVMTPARYDTVLGVSAVGFRGAWPKGAVSTLDDRKTPKGANVKHFVAKFSCTGPEIDLIGPGVAIVSLAPANRRAVMSGTSMAAPAITGLLARRLAREPNILSAPRDQARSDAILRLALKTASTLGFPETFQGRGML